MMKGLRQSASPALLHDLGKQERRIRWSNAKGNGSLSKTRRIARVCALLVLE
jgi:hypothetical protein